MNDNEIKKLLQDSKTIAMIGVSSEKKGEDRKNLKRKPANVVMKYMQDFGYKVYPINPFAKGEIINGEKVYENLEEITDSIDIVDVFRPSEEALGIAKEANIKYISNKCIKQEYQRLFLKSNPVFPVLKD